MIVICVTNILSLQCVKYCLQKSRKGKGKGKPHSQMGNDDHYFFYQPVLLKFVYCYVVFERYAHIHRVLRLTIKRNPNRRSTLQPFG